MLAEILGGISFIVMMVLATGIPEGENIKGNMIGMIISLVVFAVSCYCMKGE